MLELAQHLGELCTVDKVNGFALRKPKCFVRVNAARNEHRPVSFLRRHHAKKLPDRLYPDFIPLPALALNNRSLPAKVKPKVHTTIGSAAADFIDPIALLAVYCGYLPFKVLPAQTVQPINIEMLLEKNCSVLMRVPPGKPSGETDHRREEADKPPKRVHLRHFELHPKPRQEEEAGSDWDAPRRVNRAKHPAQRFKKLIPSARPTSCHSLFFRLCTAQYAPESSNLRARIYERLQPSHWDG